MAPNLRQRTAVLLASGSLVTAVAVVIGSTALAATTLTATFQVTRSWSTGYEGQYTIRNGGSTSVTGWRVELDLPSDTSVRKFWDSVMSRSGDHYVFTNKSYNATVPAGGSQTFGFNTIGLSQPSGCLVNGSPCDGGRPSPSASSSTGPSPTSSPTGSPTPGPTSSPTPSPSPTT